MPTRSIATLVAAFVLAAVAGAAQASLVADTGTPAGTGFPLVLDANDDYAGRFTLSQTSSVQSLSAFITGGTAGETFTLAIYADSAAHLPGGQQYAATAIMGADGWNGVSGLSGWLLGAGAYWAAIEVGPLDDLGSGSITGALLPLGVPDPLTKTAFSSGGAYAATAQPLSFGLRVDAITVPEPASWLLVLATVPLLRLGARRPLR